MLELALRDSIVDVLDDELNNVSDNILRLEPSKDWPITDAIKELFKRRLKGKVLALRPFKTTNFKGLDVSDDAGEATKWRNERQRPYAVIIIGSISGKLDAGLKDVRRVDRSKILAKCKARIIQTLKPETDLAKIEFRNLLDCIFEDLQAESATVSQLAQYLSVVGVNPHVSAVCDSLWMLGLMSDRRALDERMGTIRAKRNRESTDWLRTSDDSKIDKILREVAKQSDEKGTTAKAAIRFRESGDKKILKDIQFPVFEEIFKKTSATTPTARGMELPELLNHHDGAAADVRRALSLLSKNWNFAVPADLVAIDVSISGETRSIRVPLNPRVSAERANRSDPQLSWEWAEASAHVFAVRSGSTTPDPALDTSDVTTLRIEYLKDITTGFDECVERYVNCRSALGQYEPWLYENAVELFLLSEPARVAAREFLQAWLALVHAARDSHDNVAFVKTVQVLETVSGPSEEVNWVALGPLHPFRLEPVLHSVEWALSLIAAERSVPKLGDALDWVLDRCYPAYPAIYIGDKSLFIAASRPTPTYSVGGKAHRPDVRDSNGLDRTLRAIEGFCPWLLSGISCLVIDPPQGGGVTRAFELARKRRSDGPVVVHHLVTASDIDPLDAYNGDLRVLPRVSTLADAIPLPDVNVVVRFVADLGAGGEAAGDAWQATRGSHLALQIAELAEGPFNQQKTPKIKIDPRASNAVVRAIQDLHAKLKGGVPVHATVRPLFQTDEARVLSRLADRADWVIFAAPGPLGLVSPKTINSTLQFVGRVNMGQYGLYAYAVDDLFSVRKHFEAYFEKTPVATVSAQKMVELLVAKAQESGQAVLFAGMTSVPAQVACLIALDIAKEDSDDSDETFVLGLDELGWTNAWLTSATRTDNVRADFLVVQIKATGKIIFRVVESKSKEGGQRVPCDPGIDPYQEAVNQVKKTLLTLREISTAANPTLEQDLRFSSLIEHLMAAVMSKSHELSKGVRTRIFEYVNSLSRREIEPEFEGFAILTQIGVNEQRETRRVTDGEMKLQIVWAGATEIEKAFKVTPYVFSAPIIDEPVRTEKDSSTKSNGTDTIAASSKQNDLPAVIQGAEAGEIKPLDKSSATAISLPSPVSDLANAFIQASKIHGIPVSDLHPVYIQEGPSLVAVGIRLREGASLQPLRNRLADIARDIGLGDRASELDVENDAEPRTVRVLLPRPDRQFPPLPDKVANPISPDGTYLPIHIGQRIDGTDFRVSVEQWPHLLVAGTTGSGKTTFVRTILKQLRGYGSDVLNVIIVDGKGDTDYFGLIPEEMFPEKFQDVQQGFSAALEVLRWAEEEMERRRELIVRLARGSDSPEGVKPRDLFVKALQRQIPVPITPLILVIDEFADLMLSGKKTADEFERLVQRVSQVGRSRLMHVVLATQRPDKETVRGAIKANLNARAVFRLPTQADSMTVLGQSGAEKLMLHGDMLFQHGSGSPIRLQGYRL